MDKQTFVANLLTVKKRKILLIRVALSILFVTLVAAMWMSKAHPHDAVRTTFSGSMIPALYISTYLPALAS